MLDFQVLVLKEALNSLFEYVFLTNSYARLVLFVYLYLTVCNSIRQQKCYSVGTSQNLAKQSVNAFL